MYHSLGTTGIAVFLSLIPERMFRKQSITVMFAWKALLSKQARVIQASKTQRRCTCLSVKKINASERKQRKKDNILRFLIKLRPKEQEVTLFSCLFRLFDFRASGISVLKMYARLTTMTCLMQNTYSANKAKKSLNFLRFPFDQSWNLWAASCRSLVVEV